MRAPRLRSVEQDQGMPHDRQGYDRRSVAGVFVGWSGLAEHGGGERLVYGCACLVFYLDISPTILPLYSLRVVLSVYKSNIVFSGGGGIPMAVVGPSECFFF